ncbi:hypothetical protein [Isoptericola aurantiacus]|uniref:hypothetical protein n=1 Tax=Isoptericola aurantiacus TaxID=3377839 RepID=UPI00383B3909
MAGAHDVDPASGGDSPRRVDKPPAVLVAVLAAVGLEGVALTAFAGAVVVGLLRGQAQSLGLSLFVVFFFVGLAVLLVLCGRALWRGRRGGRAPVAGWQLFQALVGIALLTAGTPVAVLGGLALLLLAASVLVGLMTRRVVEHTVG